MAMMRTRCSDTPSRVACPDSRASESYRPATALSGRGLFVLSRGEPSRTFPRGAVTRVRRLAAAYLRGPSAESPCKPDPRPGRPGARRSFLAPVLVLLLGTLGPPAAGPAEAQNSFTISHVVVKKWIASDQGNRSAGITITATLSAQNTAVAFFKVVPQVKLKTAVSFPSFNSGGAGPSGARFNIENGHTTPTRVSGLQFCTDYAVRVHGWWPAQNRKTDNYVDVQFTTPDANNNDTCPHGRPPGKPTLTLVTSAPNPPTASTLSFTIPCVSPGNAQVTDYVLEATNTTDNSVESQFFTVVSPCRTMTVTLTGLEESTTYSVRAFARNLVGQVSWYSDSVEGTTPADTGAREDQARATVTLTASPNPVDEGNPVTVTATLSKALSSDVRIPLTLTDKTAEPGDRGTLAVIFIGAGGTSASSRITTSHDDDSDDETFTVGLDVDNLPSDVAGVIQRPITVTITDDDASGNGGGSGPYAALIAKMYEWRNDPRYVHDKRHTDRWDRALLAFGETVSDRSLTPMSAAEALGYADRGWTRWVEVAEALREIEGSGNPVIVTKRGIARETDDAVVFIVRLDRQPSNTVTVDYATADGARVWAGTGTATAGMDYRATSGTLTFAPGETRKSVSVPILDDAIDEGTEYFQLRFSNPQGATLDDREVEGLIRNTDLIPAALLARFGRVTAEQVVTHIEERMAAPRRRGFRARFAGRELQPGQEQDFALGLVSQFAQPTGMGQVGAAPMRGALPMEMGSHAAGAGALGLSTGGMAWALGTAGSAMGMGGMPGGYGPAGGAHGGGLLGSMGMGGDLFSNSEFELNRESRGGMLSVWSRSSRSYFSGLEDALSLDGDVRTTMFGADYSRGALTVGLSVGRTLGMGGYRGTSGGRMSTSMTGFYPWVGYQVSDRVSLWGVTGYGTGALSLTPDAASALETGVSMAMSAVGTRGELIGARATGGFSLAFKADALWVGAASDLVDGAMGRLNASDAGVTRVRTALEGSRGYTLVGGRLSLTPSVEVGLRRDGGDAETGAGMDVGGGLAFTDAVTGLSLDVRVRTLVVHQADGFNERGMSLSFGWDPTPSSPLGLTARVAPSWGGQARGGAEALWSNQMAYGMGSHQMYGSGDRVDAEVGYGLPVGARFVGTPRVGLATSQYGRDYRVGYGLGVLDRSDVNFELGVDAQRRESAMEGGASNGFMGRTTLGW